MAPRPYFQFIPTFFKGNNYCCVFAMTKPTITGKLVYRQESLFFPIKFLSFFLGAGYLDFYFLEVLGGFFFLGMALSLHPSLIRNTPCPHCSSLFTLGGLSRHVKNVYPPISLISQTNQVVLFL